MSKNIKLPKYSVGMGDRFAHQAKARLSACTKGVDVARNVSTNLYDRHILPIFLGR